jgi:ATP-binding cassette subfamily G (WHITE) protein 2 (SNQ2)
LQRYSVQVSLFSIFDESLLDHFVSSPPSKSALTAMAEIPSLFSQRPIILRHQKAALYHPFIEAVALTLVDIPIMAVTLLVFATIIYEAVRLQQSASQFLYVSQFNSSPTLLTWHICVCSIFFLFIFTVNLTMKAWFRTLASALKAQAPAQAIGGISILIMSLYTGYTIPKVCNSLALRCVCHLNKCSSHL